MTARFQHGTQTSCLRSAYRIATCRTTRRACPGFLPGQAHWLYSAARARSAIRRNPITHSRPFRSRELTGGIRPRRQRRGRLGGTRHNLGLCARRSGPRRRARRRSPRRRPVSQFGPVVLLLVLVWAKRQPAAAEVRPRRQQPAVSTASRSLAGCLRNRSRLERFSSGIISRMRYGRWPMCNASSPADGWPCSMVCACTTRSRLVATVVGLRGNGAARKGRRLDLFDVEQPVAVRRAFSFEQGQVATDTQAAHAGDSAGHVMNAELRPASPTFLAVGFDGLADQLEPLARDRGVIVRAADAGLAHCPCAWCSAPEALPGCHWPSIPTAPRSPHGHCGEQPHRPPPRWSPPGWPCGSVPGRPGPCSWPASASASIAPRPERCWWCTGPGPGYWMRPSPRRSR